MLRTLLIEDELPAREDLRRLLGAHPDVVIVGEAGSVAGARARLAAADYDLVFLDIQLVGGSGFDLVSDVRPGAKIIFVTAYDQHAVRAFEVNALDYLMKPVARARLAGSLARLGSASGPSSAAAGVRASAALALDDRILLKLGAGTDRFVTLGDIRCISSSLNYTELRVGPRGEYLIVRKTMKEWQALLPRAHFFRVHRQTIVNLAHVLRIERATESTSHVQLDGVAAPVAASYRFLADLRAALPPAIRAR
ncbi:MAG TPA: LytTR family DNA-binding domain-containing protein [Opitutaceae bacterium]|nr:LytTR family DNA-binding domain-containing protein [Opitutaceae bacterium]